MKKKKHLHTPLCKNLFNLQAFIQRHEQVASECSNTKGSENVMFFKPSFPVNPKTHFVLLKRFLHRFECVDAFFSPFSLIVMPSANQLSLIYWVSVFLFSIIDAGMNDNFSTQTNVFFWNKNFHFPSGPLNAPLCSQDSC